jgi:hypothetical protein
VIIFDYCNYNLMGQETKSQLGGLCGHERHDTPLNTKKMDRTDCIRVVVCPRGCLILTN